MHSIFSAFSGLSSSLRLGVGVGVTILVASCGEEGKEASEGSGGAGLSSGGATGSGSAASGGSAPASGGAGSTSSGGRASGGDNGSPAGGLGGQSGDGGTAASGGDGGTGGEPGGSGGGGGDDFFGASRCAGAGLLLCDGFETDAIDTGLWNVSKSAQNVLENTRDYAARGEQSVHIMADNGYAFLRNESIFPVANNDYYGRMFVRVERFSTVDWAHWTVAEGAGTGNDAKVRVGGQYVRTDFDTNTWANRWGVGTDGGETGDWTNADQDPLGQVVEPAILEWVCLEWQHFGSTNETRFYLDGVEHPSLYTTAQDHGGDSGQYILPQMTSFWFGWVQYQEDPMPFDVWIDEVALDDERIGCTL